MKPNRRVLFAVILAVVGGITACERTDGLGQLTGPSTPQYANNDGTRPLRLKRSGPQGVVCSQISKQGGTLPFYGGTLEVPRNAVSSPTIFCAANHSGDDIWIELSASDVGSKIQIHTFKAPVLLTVDLNGVTGIDDWSRVFVAYLNPNGDLDLMPTAQNKIDLTVTGLLPHFSDFTVAIN